MFTGFFMNMIYPSFGISGPISLTPLMITINAVVLVLCVLCYVRDKDFSDPSFIDIEEVLSPPVLFLCLIPFMAVLGTYLVNFQHTNILLMLMMIIIALVTLLICFDKFIPAKLYPLAIWVFAISVIYHNTLISMYLGIYDVFMEYRVVDLVINELLWDWTTGGAGNAVLSNVILAPVFYHICDLGLAWVFKIVYPLLFSLVPLGVYTIFQKEFDDKIAFLSCFLVISVVTFYTTIPSTTKQAIAEIFLMMMFMVMLDKNMNKLKKSFLLIIATISLIVSHYGTSYLAMFLLIFVLFFSLIETQMVKRLWRKVCFVFRRGGWGADDLTMVDKAISPTFVLFYIIFTLAWYLYITDSSGLTAIVRIWNYIQDTIFTEFLNPETSRGAYMLTREMQSPLHTVYQKFNLTIQFFIGIGILKLLIKHKEMKLTKIYSIFSLYWFIVCIIAITVSGFAAMSPGRLYHLSLLVLAPFSFIGSLTILELIAKIFKMSLEKKHIERLVRGLCIFFIIYFLFNIGFIFEITKDHPHSISLSQDSTKRFGDIEDIGLFYTFYMPEQDVFSARWLGAKMDTSARISATCGHGQGRGALHSYGAISQKEIYRLNNDTKKISEGDYIYLLYVNVVEGVGLGSNARLGYPVYFNITDVYPLLADKSRIYDNGGSQILFAQ